MKCDCPIIFDKINVIVAVSYISRILLFKYLYIWYYIILYSYRIIYGGNLKIKNKSHLRLQNLSFEWLRKRIRSYSLEFRKNFGVDENISDRVGFQTSCNSLFTEKLVALLWQLVNYYVYHTKSTVDLLPYPNSIRYNKGNMLVNVILRNLPRARRLQTDNNRLPFWD